MEDRRSAQAVTDDWGIPDTHTNSRIELAGFVFRRQGAQSLPELAFVFSEHKFPLWHL
jgi:hypothetical protein